MAFKKPSYTEYSFTCEECGDTFTAYVDFTKYGWALLCHNCEMIKGE